MVTDRKVSFEIDPGYIFFLPVPFFSMLFFIHFLRKVNAEESAQNLASLEKRCAEIIELILSEEAVNKLPLGLRIICKFVAQQAEKHAPDQVQFSSQVCLIL